MKCQEIPLSAQSYEMTGDEIVKSASSGLWKGTTHQFLVVIDRDVIEDSVVIEILRPNLFAVMNFAKFLVSYKHHRFVKSDKQLVFSN